MTFDNTPKCVKTVKNIFKSLRKTNKMVSPAAPLNSLLTWNPINDIHNMVGYPYHWIMQTGYGMYVISRAVSIIYPLCTHLIGRCYGRVDSVYVVSHIARQLCDQKIYAPFCYLKYIQSCIASLIST